MNHHILLEKYPPSEPCSCDVCTNYCKRPGWWSVVQAQQAMNLGYAKRMMLEVSPELTFAVLSPSFLGNEGKIALNYYSNKGCCFLKNGLCELHSTEVIPLECSFCHHERKGLGTKCHADIEKDWNSIYGRKLVIDWCKEIKYSEGLALMRWLKWKIS